MSSNYTNLGVQLMTTGEKAGTWGTLTNTNWNIIEQIAGGYVSQALTDDGTLTLTKNDGTAGATLATRIVVAASKFVQLPVTAPSIACPCN